MRIEQEWRDAESSYREPEVNQVGGPDRHCDIKEHNQGPHAQINTGPCEPGEQNAERYARGSKATSCCNIPSASKCQVTQDGVCVNLRRKDFEDRRAGHELLSQSNDRPSRSAFHKL